MSIQIITKKISKFLKTDQNQITFGDAREQMAKDLLANLTTVIERKADHPQPYFILVHAKLDPAYVGGNVIKERILILPEIPKTKLLGTLLFRVDNKHADATMVWNLPLDIPGPALETEQGEYKKIPGSVSVLESARNVPIFNRRLN